MKNLFKITFSACVAIALLSSSAGFSNVKSVNAASDLEYFLESTAAAAVSPNEEFDVMIKIKNPSNTPVQTVGLELTFDANILEVVDADSSENGTQINKGTLFPTIAENEVNNGVLLYTAGHTSGVTGTELLVATIPFRVKSNVGPTTTQLVFASGSNTSILGDDGTTELLNATNPLNIVISKLAINISPVSGDLQVGEEITLSFNMSNPEALELVTTEMKINYDTNVFEFIPSDTAKPTNIDVTGTSYQFIIDKDVSNGLIHFSGGSPGTSPLTGANLVIGSAKFKVKAGAPDGTSRFEFNTGETLSYVKSNVADNMIAQFNEAVFNIGNFNANTPRVEATPEGGTFSDSIEVELKVSNYPDNDVDIYYTTDGSRPDKDDNDTEKYNGAIDIDEDTTLYFYAITEDGLESDVEREKYIINDENYRITLTAEKTTVSTNEKTNITATLTDGGSVVSGKEISFSKTSGTFDVPTTFITNSSGQVTLGFTPSEEATVSAELSTDRTVFDSIKINVTTLVGRVDIIKSTLSADIDNLIPVTVKDGNGNAVPDGTFVTLTIVCDGTTKTYNGTTSDGIATINAPANDFKYGQTCTLKANSGGIDSDPKVITIATPSTATPTPSTTTRPSPGQTTNSGPKETMALTLIASLGIAYFMDRRKQKQLI